MGEIAELITKSIECKDADQLFRGYAILQH